jgi:hypothetical protein
VTFVLGLLIIGGAFLAVIGAIDAYRGRMHEDPDQPGLYNVPEDTPRGLILALAGTAVTLASGLLGLFLT